MRSENTLPLGTKVEFDRDLNFGVCEHCHNVGVRMFKCGGEWVCHHCACLMTSKADIKEENPSN